MRSERVLNTCPRWCIKSIVDGIENMFDNFRRAVSPEKQPRLPQDTGGHAWVDHEKVLTAGVDVAFDSFGTDDVSSSSDYMSVENADSRGAREAEEIEEEHAQWAGDGGASEILRRCDQG